MRSDLVLGVSTCLLPASSERTIYNGRPLVFAEYSMIRWLAGSGATVISLPFDPTAPAEVNAALATRQLRLVDALVLHGGADIDPQQYGQAPRRPEWAGQPARDAHELTLVREALVRDIPVLGICRGHQLLNVALGGSMHQHLPEDVPASLGHRDAVRYQQNYHDVVFLAGGLLARTYDTHTATINSVHHQAICRLGQGLMIEATSPKDGVIEAIRLDDPDTFALGVQWHPEFQDGDDTEDLLDPEPVLELLLEAAQQRRA